MKEENIPYHLIDKDGKYNDTSLQSRTVITKLMENSMITITNENGEVNITVICKSIQKKLS